MEPAIKVDTSNSTKTLTQQEDAIYQQLLAKYPNRSKRIPPGYQRPNFLHTYIVEVDPNANIDQVVSDFKNDPNVESAEPDYIISKPDSVTNPQSGNGVTPIEQELKNDLIAGYQYCPNVPQPLPSSSIMSEMASPNIKTQYCLNDPLFPLQWGLQKINAPQAWVYSEGEGIVVAEPDSDGVDYTHPDLKNQMWHDPITGDMGWNIINNNNNVMAIGSHGTPVAGIIAAQQNNNLGISGVAPKARLMPIVNGDDLASTIKGYMWAVVHGADIISDDHLFWPTSYQSLETVIKFAHSLGVVIVIAAGNQEVFDDFASPKNMDEVIIVGSVDQNLDQNPDPNVFSFPTGGTRLAFVAPGFNILSTKARIDPSPGPNDPRTPKPFGYAYYGGTSEATPHVAGVAALLMSAHPKWTNDYIKEVLKYTANNSVPPGNLTTGSGLLNAYAAVINNVVPPTARITNFSIIREIVPGENIVPIVGEAYGANFSHYQLFYHDGPNDQTPWINITQQIDKPVYNGILGNWNVSQLSYDNYIVRLVVTDKFGKTMEDKRWAYKEQYKFTQLTNSGRQREWLVLSGGNLAWKDTQEGNEVYSYNLNSKIQKKITPSSGNVGFFALDGSNLVWTDENRNQDVFLTNIDTSQELRLTTNGNNGFVGISGNKIVWSDFNNYNLLYCTYDSVNGCNPKIFSSNGYEPVISGNYIVYTDFTSGGNLDLYDLT